MPSLNIFLFGLSIFTLYASASNKGLVKLFKYTPERNMAEGKFEL